MAFSGLWSFVNNYHNSRLSLARLEYKKFGGTKAGVRGCFIGILIGILLSPFGGFSIILCPFLGAITGELIDGQNLETAIKSGVGSFVGFLLTSGLKIILVLMVCYHFFKAVF